MESRMIDFYPHWDAGVMLDFMVIFWIGLNYKK